MRFDFMNKQNPWYEFNCRVVRFKITENTYETVITNLSRNEFSMGDMYNFCQRIVQEIKIPKKDRIKYTYQVNFTRSVHIIREFLRKKGGKNPPVEHLIAKEILPIRPGRKYKRHVRPKTVVYFNYRYN